MRPRPSFGTDTSTLLLDPVETSGIQSSALLTGSTDLSDRMPICSEEDFEDFAINISPWLIDYRRQEVIPTALHSQQIDGSVYAVGTDGWRIEAASSDEGRRSRWVQVDLLPAATALNVGNSHRRVRQKASHTTYSRLFAALERWAELPEDWDGDRGKTPPPESLRAAKRFLTLAELLSVSPPSPYIDGDGEIGFRWRRNGDFASVAFLPDGSFVGFIREGQREPKKIDVPFGVALGSSDFVLALKNFQRAF